MELRLLLLLGLTITSNAGFSGAVSIPQGPGGTRLSPQRREEREAHGEALVPAPASQGFQDTQQEGVPLGPAETAPPKRRDKRCTCYTYKDKECVYYCHLDIIWINTPERTVPYGLSSYRGSYRGKRSIEKDQSPSPSWHPPRCSCSDRDDKQCTRFCSSARDSRRKKVSQERAQMSSQAKQPQTRASRSGQASGIL
ncbi:endothelin-3 isoform X1 [Lissotriton helveticus]